MTSGEKKVIPFSGHCLPDSITKHQLKIPSAATSSRPSPPLIALSEGLEIPESLLRRLRRLDAEQLQIMEIIAIAFERGTL